jgi:pilus assembly protein Flp/PilA
MLRRVLNVPIRRKILLCRLLRENRDLSIGVPLDNPTSPERTIPLTRFRVHPCCGLAMPGSEERLMRAISKALVNFVKKEDGPTAVEYAVMLALIVVVCIAAITTLGSNANSTFSFVGSSIQPPAAS